MTPLRVEPGVSVSRIDRTYKVKQFIRIGITRSMTRLRAALESPVVPRPYSDRVFASQLY